MTDFELFIKSNAIKKKDIATYLGTSNAFITQLCQGLVALPADKLKKIKGNDKGWDTSALTIDDAPKSLTATSNGGTASINIGSHNKVSASSELWEVKVQALNDKIELLKQQLEDKDRQIADKNGQIEFLKSLITK